MRSSGRGLTAVVAVAIAIIATRLLAQTRPSEPPPPPSMAQLQRMFDARQYQDVVRHAVKVLALKGDAAAQYDRHEVLVLKAESHLRLGDAEPAAKAFDEAAAVASDEPAAAALDRATALLARRARQNVYRPRSPSPAVSAGEGLSLLDPVGRKLALRALFDDERAAAQPRLSLPQRAPLHALIAALEAAAPLRTLELAATGAAEQTDEVLRPLCDRAGKLMGDELKAMASRVEKLDKAANKKRKMGSAYRKRGLSSAEQAELRDVLGLCERFAWAAGRFRDTTPSQAATFDAIRTDAQTLHEHATTLLNADYTVIYDRD
jgi:hypothetical protein